MEPSLIPKVLFVLNTFLSVCWLMALYSVIAIPLERMFYAQKQSILRKGIATDGAYWFISFFIQAGFATVISFFVYTLSVGQYHVFPHIVLFASWPVWAQVVCYLFIADCVQYWIHRSMHHEPLWGIHAVHHSSEELDWLSAYRRHPIEKFLLSLYGLLFLITPEAGAVVIVIAPFFTYLPHANLRWTFGPLKYVLVSPVMHRWHHTHPHEGGMKNFANIFSCIDILFGTFYMPKDRMPVTLGTSDRVVPKNVLAQLVYPFIKPSRNKPHDGT